jgi:hypothetical protein
MAEDKPLHNLSPHDYAAIEAAVMETARGRWFLSEFARRNRQADTGTLLAALARIEARVIAAEAAGQSDAAKHPAADAVFDGPRVAALWKDCLRQALSLNDPDNDILALIREYLADARDGAAALSTTAREMRQSAAKLPAAGTEAGLAQEISGRAGTLGLIAELSQVTARRMGDLAAAIELMEARLAANAGDQAPPILTDPASGPPNMTQAATAPAASNDVAATSCSPAKASLGQVPVAEPRRTPPPAMTWAVPAAQGPADGGLRDEPQRALPSLQDLQKLSPMERLKAIS